MSVLFLGQWYTPVSGGALWTLLHVMQGRAGSVELVEPCWTLQGSHYSLQEMLASLVRHGRPVGDCLHLRLSMLGC